MDKLDNVVTAIRAGQPQQLVESKQTSQENARNERLLDREIIQEVWLLMTRLFGHKWTSQFGDQVDPGNVWAASLKGLSSEQVKHGLNCLVLQGAEWPPSAPEFRKLCTGDDEVSWEHKRIERAEDEWKGMRAQWSRLEDKTGKERRKRIARENLARLKSLFGEPA
jgi:hypothetical protein